MKDRVMLFMLFAALVLIVGIVIGNLATNAVADSAAAVAADLRLP